MKIDTIPNLLRVETDNNSSEESDKILIKKNSSNEIIEYVHNLDSDTKINLNSISFESSLGISQLKVSIKNYKKIIKKITEKNI